MVRYKGYNGTAQWVQWCGAEGTVVQCRGYSGTVQVVQWRYSGTVPGTEYSETDTGVHAHRRQV